VNAVVGWFNGHLGVNDGVWANLVNAKEYMIDKSFLLTRTMEGWMGNPTIKKKPFTQTYSGQVTLLGSTATVNLPQFYPTCCAEGSARNVEYYVALTPVASASATVYTPRVVTKTDSSFTVADGRSSGTRTYEFIVIASATCDKYIQATPPAVQQPPWIPIPSPSPLPTIGCPA
ncbi:MAG: hypothetical protein QW343_02220, partial [Candidatus Norongarragalinales archaeon]